MSTVKAINLQHPNSSNINMVLGADGSVSGGLPFANRNMFINGGLNIHQRTVYTSASPKAVTSTGYYGPDRWKTEIGGSVNLSQYSYAGASPRSAVFLPGTVKSTLGSTDLIAFSQTIPVANVGSDVRYPSVDTYTSAPLTFSFTLSGAPTGTYTAFMEADYDGSGTYYVEDTKNFVSDGSAVRRSVTFAAASLAYVVNIRVGIVLAAGSSFTSSGGKAYGQTANVLSSSGNFIGISLLQLEQGSFPTKFEYRAYDQELRECQRYYWRLVPSGGYSRFGYGYAVNSTTAQVGIPLPVTMRVPPTAFEQSGTAGNYGVSYLATSAACTAVPTWVTGNTNMATLNFTTSGLTAGQGISACDYGTTSAFLGFSAEL